MYVICRLPEDKASQNALNKKSDNHPKVVVAFFLFNAYCKVEVTITTLNPVGTVGRFGVPFAVLVCMSIVMKPGLAE